jgi:hypothetical protein
VQHIDRISLPSLWLELRDLGFERRVPWLAENILEAIREQSSSELPRELSARYRRAEAVLGSFVRSARSRPGAASSDAPDLLDRTIRSQRTLDQIVAGSSEPSRRWGIATALRPKDFAAALEGARAGR